MTIGETPGLSLDAARGAGVEASLGADSRKARIAHVLQRDGVGALVVLVLIAIVSSAAVNSFATSGNIRNMLIAASFPAIIAIGMTLVIITGGIDLSVGSVFALGAVLATKALDPGKGLHMGVWAALGLAFGAALLIGLTQGLLIARVGLPPFIVTLAGLYGVRGLVFLVSKEGNDVYSAPARSNFVKFGTGSLLSLGYPVLIAIALYAIAHILLARTSFGLSIFAIGGSEDAASLMGLKVRRTKVWLYVMSALLAGLAGVLSGAYSQSGIPLGGQGAELDAIAAVVIGGTLLTGGAGSVVGTACGVLLLAVVQNIINLGAFGDIPSSAQRVVTGVFLIAVVVIQRYLNRVQRR